jgi:hypothetical protein
MKIEDNKILHIDYYVDYKDVEIKGWALLFPFSFLKEDSDDN